VTSGTLIKSFNVPCRTPALIPLAWVVVNKIQNFLPGEIIAPIEAAVHLTHEFQVFGGVDCPAYSPKSVV
jgi:hypothetical protein